jgi:8-oxo-dGTP pyrophosphatase MutT (NUDIX family)
MSQKLINDLLSKFDSALPGERAHIEMAPINRSLSSFTLKNAIEPRESAVSIILYPKDYAIHSILIQRPVYNGTHSGQIAFPGGKKEETDIHLEFTARRECFEEIGLPIESGFLIKEMTKVFIPVSNFIVYPFVFFVDFLPELIASEREVEDIIHYKIDHLLKDEHQSKMDILLPNNILQKNIPCFEIENKKIWGATALILNELKLILKD